jgi:alpha-amylase
MATLPGCQQNNRYQDYGTKRVHRTVPFVNSHDTYRPKLDASGNFLKPLGDVSGWDVGNELGGNGAHIDPREPRLAAAYAVACAVDGNPAVFFEDLLDIGTTGKRWTHLPTSETDLPIRGDIKNIIQCHQKLGFKDGNYGVPTAVNSPYFPPLSDANLTNNSANYIVFERIGKALIGITDYYHFFPPSDNSFDRQVYCKVDDSWPVGTVLYDYTGAHGLNTVTIPADRRVFIQTPPVNHSITGAFGHGYSVWAPKPAGVTFTTVQDMYDYLATYIPGRSAVTTQEWEMADDLGDSHCQSLGQGGRLPDNVTRERIAGRIFVANGTNVSYTLTPETTTGNSITIALYDTSGNIVSSASGAANTAIPVTGNWTASYTGWVTIKVRNTNSGYAGQKVWARAAYTAPTVITANSGNGLTPIKTSIWTGNKNTSDVFDCGNWEGGLIPNSSSNVIVYGHAAPFPVLTTNLSINKLTLMPGASFTVNPGINLTILSQ